MNKVNTFFYAHFTSNLNKPLQSNCGNRAWTHFRERAGDAALPKSGLGPPDVKADGCIKKVEAFEAVCATWNRASWTPWAPAGHLPVPQGLARGSTDGATCPTSITLMATPPGWHKVVLCGWHPLRKVWNERLWNRLACSVTSSEHGAGDGSSQSSPMPGSLVSPTLYGDSPCWSRACRAGPAAASRSRQAARHGAAVAQLA